MLADQFHSLLIEYQNYYHDIPEAYRRQSDLLERLNGMGVTGPAELPGHPDHHDLTYELSKGGNGAPFVDPTTKPQLALLEQSGFR